MHFLDEHKRREKFEYQPKGKSSQVSETAMSPKANESTRGKYPLERKSTQGQNRRDATRLDTFAVGDKPIGMNPYPGASRGKGTTENRTRHTGKDAVLAKWVKAILKEELSLFKVIAVGKPHLGKVRHFTL